MKQKQKNKKVAVIGAGVSGIAAAHYLLKAGCRVDLYEKSTSIGGRIGTQKIAGKQIAIGGKNIGTRADLFRNFVKENGNLNFEHFGTNWAREVDGKILKLNKKRILLYIQLIRMFGFSDLKKFLHYMSLMKNKENYYLDGADFKLISEKYDDKPLTNYFSERFCEYFLRLITVRMNGAEPNEYYMGNLGSNLGMIKLCKKVEQLEGNGMWQLLENFKKADALHIKTGCRVKRLINDQKHGIRIEFEEKNERIFNVYDAAIAASPATETAKLFVKTNPKLSRLLDEMLYNPVGIAIVKYNRPVFTKKRMAIGFDSKKIISNAGAYGIDDLSTVRYTFSGNAAKKYVDETTDPEKMLTIAEQTVSRYFQVSASDREEYVYKYLNEGLCSFSPYHHKIMDQLFNAIDGWNVALTGDYIKGASIEACFHSSKKAAETILNYMSKRPD